MNINDLFALIFEKGFTFDQIVTVMALCIAGLAIVALIKREK